MLKKLWNAITYPFVCFLVLLDEDRRLNFDGYYDRYWEKKNAKERKREAHKR